MRILHSSDWHLGRFLNSFSLIYDQAYYLDWLLRVLKSEKIDLLVVSGDIYNTVMPSVDAVSLLDEFLTKAVLELKTKVIIISGNHDSAKKLSFSSKILKRSGLFVAGGLSGIDCLSFDFNFGKVQVFLLPFFNLVEAREFFKVDKNYDTSQIFKLIFKKFGLVNLEGCFNLLCAHGLFVGGCCSLNFCDSELIVGGSEAFNIDFFEKFNYVALGHLHGSQKVGENGFYCGSPLKYSISEANHKKRVLVVDVKSIDDFKVEPIFVDLLHDVRVLEGSFCDLMRQKADDYVSIRLTDKNFIINSYAKLQERFSKILDLKFVNLNFENSCELKSLKRKEPSELFCEFYEDVVGRSMNKVESEIFFKVVEDIKKDENSEA